MPLQYIKTLYLGCKDNGEIASPEINDTTYLSIKNTQGHMELLNIISAPFIKSQMHFEIGFLNGPMKFCFLLDEKIKTFKFRPENIDTQYDAILYFLNNFQPPKNGLIISLYFIKSFKYETKAKLTSLWPLKESMQWKGDGDYITFHDYEKNCNHFDMPSYLNSPVGEIAKEIDKHSIYPVKRITYSMGEKKIFETLRHTKFHISYAGATYHSAGIIGCPTIGIYWNYYTINLHKIFQTNYKEGNTIEIGVKESFDVDCQKGFFTYDFKNKCLIKKHQDNLKHCTDKFEFLNYIKGLSNIAVRNKSYETG